MRSSALLLAAALVLPVTACGASAPAAPASMILVAVAPTANPLPTMLTGGNGLSSRVPLMATAPVILTPSETQGTIEVGGFVTFKVDSTVSWTASVSPDGLLRMIQPPVSASGITPAPAVSGVKAGVATVTLTPKGGTALVFTITVK